MELTRECHRWPSKFGGMKQASGNYHHQSIHTSDPSKIRIDEGYHLFSAKWIFCGSSKRVHPSPLGLVQGLNSLSPMRPSEACGMTGIFPPTLTWLNIRRWSFQKEAPYHSPVTQKAPRGTECIRHDVQGCRSVRLHIPKSTPCWMSVDHERIVSSSIEKYGESGRYNHCFKC